MPTISFQPDLRPELPLVDGPKEYRQQRALFVRLDDLLSQSGLEGEFFTLSMAHRRYPTGSAQCFMYLCLN